MKGEVVLYQAKLLRIYLDVMTTSEVEN